MKAHFPVLGLLVLWMALVPPVSAQPVPCTADEVTLCLLEGWIRVRVDWINQHDGGTEGVGRAVALTEETGAFWFFRPSNLEVMVKVLDGAGFNGHFWAIVGDREQYRHLTCRGWKALD